MNWMFIALGALAVLFFVLAMLVAIMQTPNIGCKHDKEN